MGWLPFAKEDGPTRGRSCGWATGASQRLHQWLQLTHQVRWHVLQHDDADVVCGTVVVVALSRVLVMGMVCVGLPKIVAQPEVISVTASMVLRP
jgi:hypothetical protein